MALGYGGCVCVLLLTLRVFTSSVAKGLLVLFFLFDVDAVGLCVVKPSSGWYVHWFIYFVKGNAPIDLWDLGKAESTRFIFSIYIQIQQTSTFYYPMNVPVKAW